MMLLPVWLLVMVDSNRRGRLYNETTLTGVIGFGKKYDILHLSSISASDRPRGSVEISPRVNEITMVLIIPAFQLLRKTPRRPQSMGMLILALANYYMVENNTKKNF